MKSIKQTVGKPKTYFIHDKYFWLLIALLIVTIATLWQTPQAWIVRSYLPRANSYAYTSVMSTDLGNLNNQQLDDKLSELKNNLENRQIVFLYNGKQWVFDAHDLGVTLNTVATKQSVLNLNKLNIFDKLRLLAGDISSRVNPTLLVDTNKCAKSLSAISIVKIAPKNAVIYFDSRVKLKPDQPGIKFNALSNCLKLNEQLSRNSFIFDAYLEPVAAALTKIDIEPKLPEIQEIVSQPVVLQYGDYRLTLSSKQLLDLLEVTKKGQVVKLDWSNKKLDSLINDIAGKLNSNNPQPSLGSCEYVVSIGGHRLNKAAVKNYIRGLGKDSLRSYTLLVGYYKPVVGKIQHVAPGSKSVYLTFDDGMQYGNQIMNYAACYGIKVTFFEIGERVGVDATALKRAVAEGHAVQSHGQVHAVFDYGDHTYAWQKSDMAQSIAGITAVTGIRPTYFRPPGGNRSANTYKAAAANGLHLILWGASSADTAPIGSGGVCANVLAGVFPGASVLMHSSKQKTANAVPCIIEGLAKRGYNMRALR